MTVPQPTPEELQARAEIDRSARYPVMFFFTSAAAWLFVAAAFGLLSSAKLRWPGFLEGCALFGYGRLFPVHTTTLVYGWAMQAGIGVMLWLMARLTRSRIEHPVAVVVAGHLWNLGVLVAVVAIWFGASRSIPLLDFPGWLWPVFAISYALCVLWLVPMYQARRNSLFYISELYLIGAAVWFPWIFLTANFLINKGSAPVQAAGTDAWYISNLIYFWFAPIALAVAYYIVPKISGRPIYSYTLAQASFWILAILAGWTGFSRYLGGPFQAWIPGISSAAAIFIIIGILLTVANLMLTLKGCSKMWKYSPSLRFTVVGMLMLAAYAVLSALSSTFVFGRYLQFSHFLVGLDTLAFYGFFSMTMFGAFYFIVPRITRAEWPSGKRIRTHFWFSTYGIITMLATMLIGGIAQGGDLVRYDDFSISVDNAGAYMVGRCAAWALITWSNLVFLQQLALMFLGKGRKTTGPTLIHAEPGEATSARAAAGVQ